MKLRKSGKSVLAAILACLMVLSLFPVSAEAASSSEIQEELDALEDENAAIQAEIDAIQSQYDATAGEIQDLVNKKSAIDQEITLPNAQIININAQIAAYGQLIADTQDQLDTAQERLQELSRQNKERIRAMEEEGGVSYWEVIFEANSFMDMLDRINMMNEIAASDERRLNQMRQIADTVTATQESLSSGKDALEQTRQELDET